MHTCTHAHAHAHTHAHTGWNMMVLFWIAVEEELEPVSARPCQLGRLGDRAGEGGVSQKHLSMSELMHWRHFSGDTATFSDPYLDHARNHITFAFQSTMSHAAQWGHQLLGRVSNRRRAPAQTLFWCMPTQHKDGYTCNHRHFQTLVRFMWPQIISKKKPCLIFTEWNIGKCITTWPKLFYCYN